MLDEAGAAAWAVLAEIAQRLRLIDADEIPLRIAAEGVNVADGVAAAGVVAEGI